jgi:hypothetical protein
VVSDIDVLRPRVEAVVLGESDGALVVGVEHDRHLGNAKNLGAEHRDPECLLGCVSLRNVLGLGGTQRDELLAL